jgi:hypothetical protein
MASPQTATPPLPSRPSPSTAATAPPRSDGAAHAEQLTREWKPTFVRRESWTPEDRKRLLQMQGIREEDIKAVREARGSV